MQIEPLAPHIASRAQRQNISSINAEKYNAALGPQTTANKGQKSQNLTQNSVFALPKPAQNIDYNNNNLSPQNSALLISAQGQTSTTEQANKSSYKFMSASTAYTNASYTAEAKLTKISVAKII